MTVNELLEGGVILRSVYEVIRISDPDAAHPYGDEKLIWRASVPRDFEKPTAWKWADREIVSIWPIHDERYPLLQIEVR